MSPSEERLTDGKPPLRVGEFALLSGFDPQTVRKLLKAGAVESVGLPGTSERRIPVGEARKLLRDLRVI